MNQGTSAALWLGMGGVAMVWGNLLLWHTRRVFKRRLQVKVAEPSKRTTPIASVK